jgi:hypothetical protein
MCQKCYRFYALPTWRRGVVRAIETAVLLLPLALFVALVLAAP